MWITLNPFPQYSNLLSWNVMSNSIPQSTYFGCPAYSEVIWKDDFFPNLLRNIWSARYTSGTLSGWWHMFLNNTTHCDYQTSVSSDVSNSMLKRFGYSYIVKQLFMAVNMMSKRSIDAPTPHSDGSVSVTLSGIVSDITSSERNLVPVYREGQALRGLIHIFSYLQLLVLVSNCPEQYCFAILIFKDRQYSAMLQLGRKCFGGPVN